jgi:hypothetical protein
MHWLTSFRVILLEGGFTPLCFTIIGGYVKYAVSLSGVYAIDETKVRHVRGRYYYVWVVRDVKTKVIPFFN